MEQNVNGIFLCPVGWGRGREWNETGVIFRWRLGKHDHRWRRLNIWKHSGLFLHLTGQRGGMCGRRGQKPGARHSWNYSNASIYFYISLCHIYMYFNIIAENKSEVRSYIDTRQPWFGDNKSLIPQTQSTRMKKVLAEPKCADHAGWVFLTDCICDCRYQLLYHVFWIQGVPPHAGHAVCCSRIPPPALN